MHLAAGPVVFTGRHFGGDQQFLRTDRIGHGLVLHRSADAVTDVDLPVEVLAGDGRVAFGVVDHFAFEDVHVADEFTDQTAGRGFVDVDRTADLGDPAQVHDRDALGHGHGFFLIVGHHHARHTHALDDFHQFQLHLRTQFLVQRAHRLVEQQQLRPLGQRTCQRHALTLTAGQLMRLALGVLAHLHQLEHLGHAGIDLGGRDLVLLETERDVLRHGHVREQRVGLEHHVDRSLVRRHVGDVDAVEENAPLRGPFEPCQHPQQSGFARSRTAEQGEDLALLDFQGHIVHGNRLVELLRDPVDFNQHLLGCLVALEGFLIGAGGNCHLRNSQKKNSAVRPRKTNPGWFARYLPDLTLVQLRVIKR